MRALLAACLMLAATTFARADDAASVSPADQTEIQRVITSQIDAFRREDGNGAFGFASPHIQSLFGNSPHFMAMVKQGYPPVYNPRSVQFDELVTIDGRIVQRVDLVGPDGLAALALYTMEREPDGTWRIDGCELTKPDRVAT